MPTHPGIGPATLRIARRASAECLAVKERGCTPPGGHFRAPDFVTTRPGTLTERLVQFGDQPPRSPCPLYHQCPRWDGPDDYYVVMEETAEQTEQRRSAWPCSRLAGLLSPELRHIGPG